jgi:hypothetical protein
MALSLAGAASAQSRPATPAAAPAAQPRPAGNLPRAADGKPDLQGIWKANNRAAYDLQDHGASLGILPGRSVVEGGTIPYLPAAAAKRAQNFATRATEDPLANCYLPGVPRIMYMDFPFQIFQTHDLIAMTFEWSQVHRMIFVDGKPAPEGIDFWMGDSRGHWDGDTFVVNVTNHNDKTWFDMAGDFHSDALHLVERYTLLDRDTLQYEVTVQDPQTFTRPWKMNMRLYRQRDMDRIYEYQCQAEVEEANGAFEREPRTWYQAPSAGTTK